MASPTRSDVPSGATGCPIGDRNDAYLNPWDSFTPPTTGAVDPALLDPDVDIGVIRGAVVATRDMPDGAPGAGVN